MDSRCVFVPSSMQPYSAANPDKTIVERRNPHAGDMSRQAVRNIRADMGNASPAYANPKSQLFPEVLRRHCMLQPYAMYAFMGFGAVAFFIGFLGLSLIAGALWFALCLGIHLITIKRSKSYLQKEADRSSVLKDEQRFMMLTALTGIIWTVPFGAVLFTRPIADIEALLFSSNLVLIALFFVSSRYIKMGVLYGALPVSAIMVVALTLSMTPSAIGLASLVIAGVVFFHYCAQSTRRSYISFLKSRAERDQLIMELETSRSVSDEARRRAEDANLAKSRFLATMSHELRTPLNAILGFSEVMSNEVMGPLNNSHYKEYVGDIHRSGAHLLKLINEILDLSRVEAGRYELNEEAVNLAHAAEESQQMVKLKASEKGVELHMQIQPDLPSIWADSRSVRQVILNLLSNALKFTPPGGSIWLKVGWTAGGGQYVSVKDTGPGIPEEEIPIVLSSFGQGSIAIKSAEQGTGLGLPIVQALVHMHGGRFDLYSKLREGTEVIATFPSTRVMATNAVQAPPMAPTDFGSQARQQTPAAATAN